jgi:hypothetical protein
VANPISLHEVTQGFFGVRDVSRDSLMVQVALGDLELFNPSPYRILTGDPYGYPASDTVMADQVKSLKDARQDPLSWSKEHAISTGLQVAVLEGFKRDLQDRRLRKGQRLKRWQTDMLQDKDRRATLVANLAGTTARRLP